MGIDEIKKLDPKERIILMNEIWETLNYEDAIVESPLWHKKVLEKRTTKLNDNKAKYISLEELKTK